MGGMNIKYRWIECILLNRMNWIPMNGVYTVKSNEFYTDECNVYCWMEQSEYRWMECILLIGMNWIPLNGINWIPLNGVNWILLNGMNWIPMRGMYTIEWNE